MLAVAEPSARTRRLQQLLREQLERLALPAADEQRVDVTLAPGLAPGGQPLADALARSHQVYLVDERVGHRRHRLHALAREVEVLDLRGRLLVAEPLHIVVVEIL